MHRQAFFSLIVAVIALCAALSIAAPTVHFRIFVKSMLTELPQARIQASRSKNQNQVPSKVVIKGTCQAGCRSSRSQEGFSARPSTESSDLLVEPSLPDRCPVKDKTRKKITKGRSIKLEGRTPNPGTTLCDVPIRENVECTGRPSPLEHVKRRSPPDSSGSEYVPSSDSSEHSSEDEDANLLECEHAVELQLLAFTFSNNGYCAALDDLVALSGIGKDAYLADIKTAINQKTNLYNIPKDTNAAKNHITTKFKAGNGASNAATAPFDPENVIQWGRVKTYLNTAYVSSNAATLVKSIDTKATTLLQKARLDAENCQASQTKIDSAKAKFEPSEGTMVTIWENYVKYVTTQAEVKK
ncbi:hypothetical protein EV368DRAFT_60463 [Lentinula lateritia]|nr:hypothetical protein EV368DRAFT_60463 [Lentinula lateritia]